MLDRVLKACEDMDVTILYYTTISPFDCDLLNENFNENIIICEPYYEGCLNYEINKTFTNKNHRILNIGVPHKFLKNYGKKEEHDANLGLDVVSICEKIKKFIC
jgi:transketolase